MGEKSSLNLEIATFDQTCLQYVIKNYTIR